MMLKQIAKSQSKLDSLFQKVNSLTEDLELQSHWACYLCILVSGFLETTVRLIYIQYAKDKANTNITNFVTEQLKNFQNPKMEKILNLTRMFNRSWENRLKIETEGELRDSVNSIVANRNKIAHGEWVGITYLSMFNYYKNAKRVIDIISKQCNS